MRTFRPLCTNPRMIFVGRMAQEKVEGGLQHIKVDNLIHPLTDEHIGPLVFYQAKALPLPLDKPTNLILILCLTSQVLGLFSTVFLKLKS